MKLSIGLSPCPNDTFIFDAMLHGKIDTEGLSFHPRLEDVETLNRLAITGVLDITKISYGALARVFPHYRVLEAGGALGKGVGPLFVSKKYHHLTELDPEKITVILPGSYTTAHLLFHLAHPNITSKIFLPFNQIEDAIANEKADAGIIIHENRFTYAEKGLNKLEDLGDTWHANTGYPIPLGGIIAKRHFDIELLRTLNRVIKKSLAFAMQHKLTLSAFVQEHAQNMNPTVMQQHIDLYVNEYSFGLGSEGRAAVWKLLELSASLHPVPQNSNFEVFTD